ncbi:angiomotin-like [Anneissia japonica]|uniref:angiomotin-like n=1 Tax=Anneissia japonica TaxID=1529436 RepID=UPI0014255A2A|nr:angiomotin-like [Anneissia japonica]
MAQIGPVKTMLQTTHSLLFTAAVMPQNSSTQNGSALHRQTKSDEHLLLVEKLKHHKPSLSEDLQIFKDNSSPLEKSNWEDFVPGSGTPDKNGQLTNELDDQGFAGPRNVSVNVTHLPQYDRMQSLGQTSILESLSREFGTSFHMQLPVITNQEQLVVTDLDKRPPPPDYPGTLTGPEHGLPISNTVGNVAYGGDTDPQPEGSRSAEALEETVKEKSPVSHTKHNSNFEVDHEAIAGRATKMVEILSEENTALRQELEGYYQKVSKLQKFEQDVNKVQAAHQKIVESTIKREVLETKMRVKLELDVKRLQEENKELRASAECLQNAKLTAQESQYILDSDLKAELAKKDTIITHLIAQRKHSSFKTVSAQTATLTEQRNHIDLLDTVLSNAQANVSKMQEESRKRQILEEQVESLQKTMFAMKAANLKREKKDQELRLDLERQIENLKKQQNNTRSNEEETGGSDCQSNQSLLEMLKKKEEKICSLETEISKMELKLQEESAIKMVAQSNIQRDARIAALEKNSIEAEKILVDTQTERTRQAEDIYLAKKRVAELEATIRVLQSELAHKDSLIQVLQQQSLQKDASLSSLEKLLRTTTSPHSSLQNLRMGSSESVQQQSRLSGSSNSLQNLSQKSPVNSMQNLTVKSPAGSYQNLSIRPQGKGHGSQERLLMMGDSYMSHSTSALSSIGLQEVEKRHVLDEKLKKLDQDIAQQDKILDSLFKKSSGQNV